MSQYGPPESGWTPPRPPNQPPHQNPNPGNVPYQDPNTNSWPRSGGDYHTDAPPSYPVPPSSGTGGVGGPAYGQPGPNPSRTGMDNRPVVTTTITRIPPGPASSRRHHRAVDSALARSSE